jgi:hypothetical protein
MNEFVVQSVATSLGLTYHPPAWPIITDMNDDHEVDWGNDEDVPMLPGEYYNSVGMDHGTGGAEPDDVEDAVSLGGDEEEEFAAYGARSNEQNSPSADKFPTTFSKRGARTRSASVGVSPKKEMSRDQPSPLPPSPQSEIRQSNPKLTHALPPKPVVSSSIRAPPSTTAASPMSLPRKERRSNGSISKKGDEPLPSPLDRETINSRTTAGRDGRQRDSHADEIPWARPGSGDTDSQSLHRDRTRGFVERDGGPPSRREDDYYRPSHRQAHYSSDEEGREPYSHREQSHLDRDARYRYDDRDRYHDYASGDRTDRPIPRSARLSPEDEAVDRSRTGYREANDPDTRRAHPRDRDRDASPVRDDRRVLRRDAYLYDSSDKGSRDFDDPPRRSTGTAERSRYPETFNGRTNSVGLRDSHTHNQGPGRSSTLSTLSASCRPMPNAPHAFYSRGGGPIFLFPAMPWELSSTRIYASTDSQVFIVAFSIFVSMLYTMSHSQQLFPPHVSSYRTQFPFTSPAVTVTPLQPS